MRRLLALALLWLAPAIARPGTTYLTVPFENSSGQPALDWIGESIAQAVRETLGSYGVAVVGRKRLERAARELSIRVPAPLTEATVIRLARRLGAGRVIYGKFHYQPGRKTASSQAGGRLQILGRSIDLQRFTRGPHWEESGPVVKLSELQDRLAWRVLTYASPATAPSSREFFTARAPVRTDALESYIRGLLASTPGRQRLLFARAANLDPGFSAPCFELGRLEWSDNNYRAAARWLQRVGPHDPRYLAAKFLLGLCRYETGNYAGALAAFRVVAGAVSLSAVYNNLAMAEYRSHAGGAMENLRKAIGGDPKDPDYHFNLGYLRWQAGELASAAACFRRALALDPGDVEARRMLHRCESGDGPRRGDLSTASLERLKKDYQRIPSRPAGIGESGSEE